MTAAPSGSPDGEDVVPTEPARPSAVEFASTVMVAGGAFRLVAVALAIGAPPETGLARDAAIVAIESVLWVLSMVVGILVRFGRAWIAAINLVAVLAFLQLISLVGPVSVFYGVVFLLAFVLLFRHKPWFDAMRAYRALRAVDRRA